MGDTLKFPEYSVAYSNVAQGLKQSLSAQLRPVLDEIETLLSDNPDQFPARTIPLAEDIFVYRHLDPHLEITYRINRDRKVLYFLHIVAPQLEVTKPLFISYSHKDQEWLVELKKWLKPLEQKDLIKIWDDTEIKAGDEWRSKIEKALASAKAAVLLVSQDFLASEFITNSELPVLLDAAKEKGLKIYWIAVRPSVVDDTQIAKYQAVHKNPPLNELDPQEREKRFLQIYNTIKQAIS